MLRTVHTKQIYNTQEAVFWFKVANYVKVWILKHRISELLEGGDRDISVGDPEAKD